jgi:hypothetical protein
VIITDFQSDFSNQERLVRNKSGDVIGAGYYGEMYELKISGLVPVTSGFSGKLAAVLAVANSVGAHLQSASAGTTITQTVGRSLNNEDFESIEIGAKFYPELAVA